MVVMGVGTGGTATGVGKRLKEEIKDIKIIGADPYGSILGGCLLYTSPSPRDRG